MTSLFRSRNVQLHKSNSEVKIGENLSFWEKEQKKNVCIIHLFVCLFVCLLKYVLKTFFINKSEIFWLNFTEGSGMPTMRPKTGSLV